MVTLSCVHLYSRSGLPCVLTLLGRCYSLPEQVQLHSDCSCHVLYRHPFQSVVYVHHKLLRLHLLAGSYYQRGGSVVKDVRAPEVLQRVEGGLQQRSPVIADQG